MDEEERNRRRFDLACRGNLLRARFDFFFGMALDAVAEKQIADGVDVGRLAVPIEKIGRREENGGGLDAGAVTQRRSGAGFSLVGSEGSESGQMPARRSAGDAETLRVNAIIRSVLFDVANADFHVLVHFRGGVTRAGPGTNRKHHIAMRAEDGIDLPADMIANLAAVRMIR